MPLIVYITMKWTNYLPVTGYRLNPDDILISMATLE
jgi:hypothetical protein